MSDDEFLLKVARIAVAIQRAGDDHLGDVSSIQQDFLEILESRKAFKESLEKLWEYI